MPHTLQPVLHCDNRSGSDMTVFQSRCGKTYEVYLGLGLLERVPVDPEALRRRMLVGRLHNVGVGLRELGGTFGHDPRSVKKWGRALLSDDADELARAFAGRRGRGKVTPELVRYVRQLYRDRDMLGRNYRQVIIDKVKEVFQVRISSTLASRIFRLEHPVEPPVPEVPVVATAVQEEPVSSTESLCSVKQSPTPLPAQTCHTGIGSPELIHHAGQALFAGEMQGFQCPLQRQLIAQILQGAVNVEQSKTVCGKSLANFTGPVLSTLRWQRAGLDRQAEPEAVLRVYLRNAQLLSDGPNRGDLFYFDPHTKEYTGQLRVLKGWCGRRHGVTKVVNLDMFHTRSGRPCFARHYSPYYDMRERFFMNRVLFDRLFDAGKRRGRTFVIDRAIYSLAALQSFGEDDVITWEKNYSGNGWKEGAEALTFTRWRTKNASQDRQTITFRCQESRWQRDASFRRIIVRASKPASEEIEVAVITSHATMAVEDVVWAIFRRWLQENDFKYLDTHFGLNQLTSRDSLSFEEEAAQLQDRPVDSPEYREMKSELRVLEARLGAQLVQLRRCEKQQKDLQIQQGKLRAAKVRLEVRLKQEIIRLRQDLPPLRPRTGGDPLDGPARYRHQANQLRKRLEAVASKRGKLQNKVAAIEARIEPLERSLLKAVRTESRLCLLIDGHYRLLDTRKKAMMDALRIAASNMFRNLQERFRAIYNNFRDDHVLVRMLTRCSGTMIKTPDAVVFRLWLPGALQTHRVRAFERFLIALESEMNCRLAPYKPIRLKLVTGPVRV